MADDDVPGELAAFVAGLYISAGDEGIPDLSELVAGMGLGLFSTGQLERAAERWTANNVDTDSFHAAALARDRRYKGGRSDG